MSEANEALVAPPMRAHSQGDAGALLEVIHPDLDWTYPWPSRRLRRRKRGTGLRRLGPGPACNSQSIQLPGPAMNPSVLAAV
jgi:hypothetical protein